MNMQTDTHPRGPFQYRLLRIAGERFGTSPDNMNQQQTREAEDIAKREILMEQAILQQPEARQVAVPPSELNSAIAMIRDRYEDPDAYEQALAANGLDDVSLRASVERELRVEAVLNYVSSRVPEVSETEARLYYYLHPEAFQKPETRVARHILITVNDQFPENTAAAARERMATILARLRKHPHRFEQQALQNSECPSALHGGLIGEVKQGTLYPELDRVLFQLRAGEISDLIESDNGWHIIKCDAINPAQPAVLGDVLGPLRQQLTQRQREREQRRWLKQILTATSK
ncbi:MAG: nitrogen fixation protein NifM [Pseudomonadota bacterium]|nr:nitrogen fixation protein NifM [Pseudomonadales bacterium]MDY6921274.1 nitrogen fixation protein NifM [Pseudomonadota bacterium]